MPDSSSCGLCEYGSIDSDLGSFGRGLSRIYEGEARRELPELARGIADTKERRLVSRGRASALMESRGIIFRGVGGTGLASVEERDGLVGEFK